MRRQNQQSRFVLCIRNDGSEDLEPRKVYEVLDDPKADREGYVRVIDESGEDYLYPSDYFVKLPASVSQELLSSSQRDLRSTTRIRRRAASARLRASRG
jgi:hypothetical protein